MALVKVRRAAQITLPAAVRKQLDIAEGDYLEANVFKGRLALKPVSAAGRQRAWQHIREADRSVRYAGPEPRPARRRSRRFLTRSKPFGASVPAPRLRVCIA
jgi:AbrB family looped-hinge helix DNA binding protein